MRLEYEVSPMTTRFAALFITVGAVLACLAPSANAQVDVGSGSPSQSVTQAFIDAYYRNGFNRLVSVPPLADVRKFGTIGFVQEFQDAAKTTGVRLALIKPNSILSISETSIGVFQVQAAIYAYYNTVTVNNAGYPASDTLTCPTLVSATVATNSCVYQLFDKPYALFSYASLGQLLSSNLSIRDPFYTRWNAQGGIITYGPPVISETSTTGGVNGGVSTAQTYDKGVIFNVTSGSLTGRLLSVKGDIYAVYAANGGATGTLGYPLGDEVLLSNGRYRQSFEGGSIEYDPNSPGSGILRPPVLSVQLTPSISSVRLNLGETYAVAAAVFGSLGAFSDRQVVWTTSNSRVVAVQPNGLSVTLRAVGGGTANIAATAEGKTSTIISVFVSAPCCQVGEGAPTAATQQAFQDAVTRSKLQIKLPAASAVVRVSAGFVQDLQTADGQFSILVAVPAKSLSGYVVSGALLGRYFSFGGPTGPLGLPNSDVSAAGRQNFDGGALAGSPVQLVTGSILSRWASLSYEAGILGLPADSAASILTFRATSLLAQTFAKGDIYLATTGSQANRPYVVTGLIQAAFKTAGGATGSLGAPVSDEVGINSRRRQDFEGGFVDYAPGDTVAKATLNRRQPLVSATPATVLAGTTVRLAIGGFDTNSTVRVSLTGQPDFRVTTTSGAYVWDAFIPTAARTATVTVTATQETGSVTAQSSYTIRAVSDALLTLSIVRGDAQTGAPGANLAEPLRVALRDQNGNPAAGQTVTFAASPGASVFPASIVTDLKGEATAFLRLPVRDGIALATASAARQTVTFGARSAAVSVPNYPKFTQALDQPLGSGTTTIREKGAMLTAFASLLRFYQDQGDAPMPNGLADPLTLNAFLKMLCPLDTQGAPACDGFYTPAGSQEQIVNPWRVPAFVGNAVDLSPPVAAAVTAVLIIGPPPDLVTLLLNQVRDLVSQGTPVLIALSITAGGAPQGAHFVVATGVAADGGISIFDPNPVYGRTQLNDYLTGFANNGQTVVATPFGTPLYFLTQPFRSTFLFIGNGPLSIASLSGSCTSRFQTLDAIASPGVPPTAAPRALHFTACDGLDNAYQLDVSPEANRLGDASVSGVFRDLANPGTRTEVNGSSPIARIITRASSQWTLSPVVPSFTTAAVINAASGTPDIAPGSIASIYGTGFGMDPAATKVDIGGVAARIVSVTPFQLNVQFTEAVPAGTGTLQVVSPSGSAQQPVSLKSVAPGIFAFPGQAAITNQNASLNSASNPAARGQAIVIYCTGLGATTAQGNLRPAVTLVRVLLGTQELTPFYAGGTPGTPGLYQVNVIIPAATPPALAASVALRQGSVTSNTVAVSIQ